MQVCGDCGHVNYPPRELCGACLADGLGWQLVNSQGTVQSLTELQYSLEEDYARSLPWRVASVKLDCGPIALAHLGPSAVVQDRVTLRVMSDPHGNLMLVALGESQGETDAWLETVNFQEDSQ